MLAALADALTPPGATWSYAGNILADTATKLVLNQKRGQIFPPSAARILSRHGGTKCDTSHFDDRPASGLGSPGAA